MIKNITVTISPAPLDICEAMRYLGYRTDADDAVKAELLAAFETLKGEMSYNAVYTELPIKLQADSVDFGIFKVSSHSLAKRLSGCSSAIIFAATLGLGADRIIKKYSATDPARALFLDAVANERIEALCDALCDNLRARCGETTARFSPGYGDLALEFQKPIFELLLPEKSIGLYLNDSLLMTPMKSVTAVVGICKKYDSN